MSAEEREAIGIAEAARLLDVHKNTVRHRIKTGRYEAYKVATPIGEQYLVRYASLAPDLAAADSVPRTARPGRPRKTPAENEVVTTVDDLVAPFVRELEAAHRRVGRLEGELEALQVTRAAEAEAAGNHIRDLELRVRELETMLDRVRQRLSRQRADRT